MIFYACYLKFDRTLLDDLFQVQPVYLDSSERDLAYAGFKLSLPMIILLTVRLLRYIVVLNRMHNRFSNFLNQKLMLDIATVLYNKKEYEKRKD